MSVLAEILEDKRAEVAARSRAVPLAALREQVRQMPAPRSLARALAPPRPGDPVAHRVIAEVKKASPSRGVIRADFDPVRIARAYAANGAAALSVLTDEKHFQGKPEFLQAIRREVDLPILRKDFLIADYQVWESRALGADAVLIILAAVDDAQATALDREARGLGLEVLWEVHDGGELERARAFAPALIGINNRDLNSFAVSLETTRRLVPELPRGAVAVSESGFSTRAELDAMAKWGVNAFLIGESLMRAADPGEALRVLVHPREVRP